MKIDNEGNEIYDKVSDGDRRYKLCECSICGITSICTILFDYYDMPDGKLKCERCFGEQWNSEVIKPFLEAMGNNENNN